MMNPNLSKAQFTLHGNDSEGNYVTQKVMHGADVKDAAAWWRSAGLKASEASHEGECGPKCKFGQS